MLPQYYVKSSVFIMTPTPHAVLSFAASDNFAFTAADYRDGLAHIKLVLLLAAHTSTAELLQQFRAITINLPIPRNKLFITSGTGPMKTPNFSQIGTRASGRGPAEFITKQDLITS
ncbi:hypothetical protein WI665_15695 [Vibrio cholerae]